MKLNEIILIEHIVNIFSDEDKFKYAEKVWNLLQKSYEKVGGFHSAHSPEELIKKSGLWKLVVRNGNITAIRIYKNQFGRKAIASGTNGTTQGKKDYVMIDNEDISLGRAWAEVSGAPEYIMKKAGAIPIPAKFAEFLTKHSLISISSDGFHYIRLIKGEPHEKIIYGTASLTDSEKKQAQKLGIEFKSL
jgi:hypothetical protein